MRQVIVLVMILSLASLAMAYELGTQVPGKDDSHVNPQEGVHPRQGGDTVFDATPIGGLPFNDLGTTVGYNDDYEESCPYSSTSPDVVYSFVTAADMFIDVDLCGSAYDTKLFMYDAVLNVIACNDDFYFDDICGVYVSKLENVALLGGETYFIVVDGYAGDYGDYVLEVSENIHCVLDCPDGVAQEGEPELMDGYVDNYNGGCNTDDANPLDYVQEVQFGDFCGVSGWYDDGFRDTDWFVITQPPFGFIVWHCDAEQATYMFEILNMPDCETIELGQQATAGPCLPASLTLYGEPGSQVYLWLGPVDYFPPTGFEGHEYDYVCEFFTEAIATENTTWSQLKAMYR